GRGPTDGDGVQERRDPPHHCRRRRGLFVILERHLGAHERPSPVVLTVACRTRRCSGRQSAAGLLRCRRRVSWIAPPLALAVHAHPPSGPPRPCSRRSSTSSPLLLLYSATSIATKRGFQPQRRQEASAGGGSRGGLAPSMPRRSPRDEPPRSGGIRRAVAAQGATPDPDAPLQPCQPRPDAHPCPL